MKLLTTSKIQDILEESFNNNVDKKSVKITVKEKGKQRIANKEVALSELRKTYLLPCQLILSEILTIQQRKHQFNHYVNLSKVQLERYISSRTRLTAMFILEHTLGIIEVNHKYRFNDKGNINNFTKAYIIAKQFQGDVISIGGCTIRGEVDQDNIKGAPYGEITNNNAIKGAPYGKIVNNIRRREKKACIGAPVICETTGRVYNDINRMKKEDRGLLKDKNGNRLIDVDFSSSHLQMLIKAIRSDLRTGQYEPMFGVNGKDYLIQEVLKFKQDVLNQDFYTSVANEYSTMNGTSYSRDLAKLNVLYWLTGCFTSRKFIQFLRKKYEQITHYIDHVNKNESSGYKTITSKTFRMSVKKKNGMAVKLMKIESTLVNEIYRTLTEKYTSITLHSIFDGFLVDQEHKDILLKTIQEKSIEHLGFEAKIKVCENEIVASTMTTGTVDELNEENLIEAKETETNPTTTTTNTGITEIKNQTEMTIYEKANEFTLELIEVYFKLDDELKDELLKKLHIEDDKYLFEKLLKNRSLKFQANDAAVNVINNNEPAAQSIIETYSMFELHNSL